MADAIPTLLVICSKGGITWGRVKALLGVLFLKPAH